MWAPGSYNKLEFLRDPKTIFKYMLYVPINPVAAGLVRRAKDRPGVKVLPHEIGQRVWKVDRPDVFFDPNGEMPESVVLETSLPRIRGMLAEDVRSKLIADLKERERTIQQERKSKKKGFLGAKAVLAPSPFAYPKGFRSDSFQWVRSVALQATSDRRSVATSRKAARPSSRTR